MIFVVSVQVTICPFWSCYIGYRLYSFVLFLSWETCTIHLHVIC